MFFDLLWFLRTMGGLKIGYLLAFQLHQLAYWSRHIYWIFLLCSVHASNGEKSKQVSITCRWKRVESIRLWRLTRNGNLLYVKKSLYSRKSALIDKTYSYRDYLVVHNEMKFCIRDRDTDKNIYGQSCAQIPLIWKLNKTGSSNSLFRMSLFWSQLMAILERLTETQCL